MFEPGKGSFLGKNQRPKVPERASECWAKFDEHNNNILCIRSLPDIKAGGRKNKMNRLPYI